MAGENSSGRVVVVGGGIAGGTVALELLARDVDVTVVERDSTEGRATPASAGMLAPQYETSVQTPLFRAGLEARDHFPEFARRLESLARGSLPLRFDGMLVAAFDDDEVRHARDATAAQREAGLRAEVLETAEARELEPLASPDALAHQWLPDEGRVDTGALDRLLPRGLEAAGGDLRPGPGARTLLISGGRARGVRLEDGQEVEGDAVVLAAGAWTARLEGLPRALPVRPVRGQMLRYADGRDGPRLRRLLADPHGRYLVPASDGGLLAGTTMEEAGFDPSVTPEGERVIREAAARLCPGLRHARPAEGWGGLRPVSPDDRPVLGADPEVEELYWATGYGRNGILLGPLAGRELARLVTEGTSRLDMTPFRPDRFRAGNPT